MVSSPALMTKTTTCLAPDQVQAAPVRLAKPAAPQRFAMAAAARSSEPEPGQLLVQDRAGHESRGSGAPGRVNQDDGAVRRQAYGRDGPVPRRLGPQLTPAMRQPDQQE